MDGCSWPPYQARDGARAIFSGDMPWHKARYVRYDLLVSRDRSAQLDIATARCYDHRNNPSILISAWVCRCVVTAAATTLIVFTARGKGRTW
jgi:hypothetical protein